MLLSVAPAVSLLHHTPLKFLQLKTNCILCGAESHDMRAACSGMFFDSNRGVKLCAMRGTEPACGIDPRCWMERRQSHSLTFSEPSCGSTLLHLTFTNRRRSFGSEF
ncbi:hypothetical protein BRADI_2g05685v3 [Brachypodium distachyon]|uniref:Uncharacterized protein n=1 Tax=Brachypodium distachyon TaxID=15368 RepID=A0A2K2D751_BRADI|nr:hypothetical protein BRADI_2g05685v3 [Brachypodium distachyon]